MLIALLAIAVLSLGSRRPLALVQRHGDARDDRRPGRVPPPTVAQETRAPCDRRTAPRGLAHLWSCSTDRKYKTTFSPPPLLPASASGRCALAALAVWTCRLGWGRLKPRFLGAKIGS